MNRKKIPRALGLSLLIASAMNISACTAPAEVTVEKEASETGGSEKSVSQEAVSFFATNAQGERLEGIRSETDGNYYLFVPSTQKISEIVVHYEGNVSGVSAGKLEEKETSIAGAFKDNGDKVEVTTADGTKAILTVMQSKLPAVQLYLKDTTLETVHQDKDKKYKGNTFVLTDPAGKYDLTVEDSVEFKGRGNSSWAGWEKKGYQIKFEDKMDLFDLGKAKKWVLLPNAADDSLMRSKLVFDMTENFDMAFVPSFEFVELWIDGDYRGLYQLGEKVEPGKARLNLEQPSGVMFEHDVGFYDEEEYWFYSEPLRRQFALKEIVEEEPDIMEQAMKDFHQAVDELTNWLYTTPSEEITLAQLSEKIDVDSFAKYYLINEFVLNRESFQSSFYWYQDGPEDVLHLGPIWDFDTCMGNDSEDITERHGYEHPLFAYLLEIPEFLERTRELYEQYKDEFASLIDDSAVLKEQIEDAAVMNYLRWDQLGKPNPKAPMLPHHETFDESVTAVQEWLKERIKVFKVGDDSSVICEPNDDCSELKITFDDQQEYEKVRFAVSRCDDDNRILLWEDAELIDSVWQGSVPLGIFNSAGIYDVKVYPDEAAKPVAVGRDYVGKAAEPAYQLDLEFSENGKKLQFTLEHKEPEQQIHENIRFAVWSEVNNQDDLQWFMAEQNSDGDWEYTAKTKEFPDDGMYYIHAYGDTDGISEMLDAARIEINSAKTAKE